jgi:chromosomal replication initiation ATPase DnaA
MTLKIFNRYVNKVCYLFNIDKDTLFTKNKRRDIVDARHLLYYLCSKRPIKTVYIQEYMSSNGYYTAHSTINHGISMVSGKVTNKNKDYISNIKLITEDA